MVPACVILSLGLWSCINAPGRGRALAKLLTIAGALKNHMDFVYRAWGFRVC